MSVTRLQISTCITVYDTLKFNLFDILVVCVPVINFTSCVVKTVYIHLNGLHFTQITDCSIIQEPHPVIPTYMYCNQIKRLND